MYKPRFGEGYEDIIDLPHHTSAERARMPMSDRAAQFSPFAALTGHDEAIKETARRTECRIEQAEDAKAALDEKLRLLADNTDGWPEIYVRYFIADEKKAGGAYVELCGRVKKIDEYERQLVLLDGKKLPIDDIIEIESSIFPPFLDDLV